MNEFSVCLFFPDGSSLYERRNLGLEAAVMLAKDCTLRPAALAGFIRRAIITDDDDCTCFEWTYGQGVTYPPRGPDGHFGNQQEVPHA
jgi:hypothetical protein